MERTLDWLRKAGYTVAKTEHWNHYARIRQDLFGFIDVLAVNHVHLLALQVSHEDRHADHVKKVMTTPVAKELCYYMDIEVWSWGKRGPRGKAKKWTLRRDCLTARLLPKDSLMRRKIEEGTWDVAK